MQYENVHAILFSSTQFPLRFEFSTLEIDFEIVNVLDKHRRNRITREHENFDFQFSDEMDKLILDFSTPFMLNVFEKYCEG